jgi:molecular chaperone GrpE (heat shock protein)
MTNRPPAPLAKWPFILTDVLLLVGFGWAMRYVLPPRSTFDYLAMVTLAILWMVAAWISILPWLKEFQAQVKFAEQESINTALEQIQRLEDVGNRVQAASATWQSAQDAATRVTAAAKEIEEKIRADSKDFMEFAERINNDEKQHLRLEVEKLRRNEAEWIQVAARMLDHTFAITSAAMRSGQPNLATQMSNFQNACRDAARRVGLVPFLPVVGDPFEERSQQLEEPNAKPEEGSVVSDILATGYTFQGQLLRKALVRVSKAGESPTTEPAQEAVAPEPRPEPAETPAVAEQTAVAEQAEETHEHGTQAEQSSDQWEGLEESFEEQAEAEASPEGEVIERGAAFEEDASAETLHNDVAHNGNLPRETATESEPVVEVAHEEEGGEQPAEVAATENPEQAAAEPEGERPRRRQRKPDPQTSLPF